MGVFHTMVRVRNLAPVPLNVTFDGQTTRVPPGEHEIPKIALANAMNQNPIMGTADAWNPNISGGKYLIVPVATKYDREPLTKLEWETHLDRPCRIDEKAYFEDRLGPKERVVSRGKGRKTQARGLYDTDVRAAGSGSVDEAIADIR